MSDPQNASSEFADEGILRDGPGAYQLTARDLSYPEQLVVAPLPTRKDEFADWWLNFQYDVFQHVPDSFVYPTLRQSDTYYTIRFEDGHGRAYEVGVCPVVDAVFTGHNTNVIKVHIRSPEMPDSYEAKLRSSYYPVDQFNVALMTTEYSPYTVLQSSASSLLSARSDLARRPPPLEDAVGVPSEWQFVFKSRFGEERECGTNSIPQILGRVWFLRDALNAPIQYTLVELNQLAYVGLLRNVAGFNVFFQVNCSMPMTRLESYFSTFQPRCPLLSRAAASGDNTALGTGVVRAPAGPVGSSLAVLASASATIEKQLDLLSRQYNGEIVGKASTQREDLFKRVLTHAKGRADAYSKMVRHRREQQYIESIQRVSGAVLGELLAPKTGVAREASLLRKSQLLDAAFETKFLAMCSVIQAIPPSEMEAFAGRVDAYKTVVDKVSWTNVAQVLATAPSARVRHNVAATFVPSVCADLGDLLAGLSAYPEHLPPELLQKQFGISAASSAEAVEEMTTKRRAWWCVAVPSQLRPRAACLACLTDAGACWDRQRNEQRTVDVLDKAQRGITMAQFALWYTAQLFSQSAAGPLVANGGWKDAFQGGAARIAGM